MKKVFFILLYTLTNSLFGQAGFTYSYVDPCSRQTKTIFVTGNQNVTVNYLGNLGSFSQTDFQNGNFDSWITQIQSQINNSPCDELLTNTVISQNMFITQNLISTLTSVTSASSMIASNAISNGVTNSSPLSKNKSGGSSSNNTQNSSTNATGGNSQGNISNGSSSSNGGSQQGGSQPSGSSTSSGSNQEGGTTGQSNNVPQERGGTSERGVNNPSNPQGQSQGQSVSEDGSVVNSGGSGAGTTNSISNAAEATSSGGGKGGRANVGSVVGTGDIVAIRVNDDKSNQLRGTMSVTKSNTNNTKAKGFLLNYTTTVNNSNLTFYGAFNNKNKTNSFIIANSSMIDFNRNFFNTTTALESKKFGKTALMGGLNFTVGGLGGEMFTNLSAVGGGFHPFKVSKNLSGNILVLGVYSPFTKFYEGKWWDSGLLIVPFSSWDYSISKNFKYNVSISGTYELKGNFLQFQVLTGGKILL